MLCISLLGTEYQLLGLIMNMIVLNRDLPLFREGLERDHVHTN